MVGYPSRGGPKMRTFSHGAAAGLVGKTGTTPKSGSASPVPEGLANRFSVRRGSEGAPSMAMRISPFAPLAKRENASKGVSDSS